MRLSHILISLVLTVLLTACFEMEERLTLNRDGSGERVISIDMGELLNNPLVKQGIQAGMEEDGDVDLTRRVDSAFSIYEPLADQNPQWTAREIALIKKASGHAIVDFQEEELKIKVTYPFTSLDELEEVNRLMREANVPEDTDNGAPLANSIGNSATTTEYTLDRRLLSIQTTIDRGMNQFFDMGDTDDETGFMKAFFEEATYTLIVRLPGRIRKVEGYEGYELSDNELTVELPLLDVINTEGRVDALSGDIKFRR